MGCLFRCTAAEVEDRGLASQQRYFAAWELPARTAIPGLHDPDGVALAGVKPSGHDNGVYSFG